MKKKILIVTKHPESKGGVVNYYNHFFKVFSHDQFQLEWFVIGSRPKDYDNRQRRKLSYAIEFVKDIFRFFTLLVKDRKIAIVQVSPSFMTVPILRDSIYLLMAKIFRKKTVTFFRGWSRQYEQEITTSSGINKSVVKYYRKSDKILVLAEKFKNVLVSIGYNYKNIEVTRTMYVHEDIEKRNKNNSEQLVFLYIGRLSVQKGILDIIEALSLLNKKGFRVDVELYGHYANEEIKIRSIEKIESYQLKNQVKINSFISGEEKYQKLANADVFLFPTYHDEGCPNSVIEALASGLYVISTPIGAIDEIVVDGENGSILPIKSYEQLAERMEWCLTYPEKVREIGVSNRKYATRNFEQSVIMSKIYETYNDLA